MPRQGVSGHVKRVSRQGGYQARGVAQARNCLLAHLPSVCFRACSTMFQKLLAMDLNNCQPQGWPLIGSHARNFSFSLLTCSLISLHEMKHTNCSALLIGSSLGLVILARADPRARGSRRCLQRSQEVALGLGFPVAYSESHWQLPRTHLRWLCIQRPLTGRRKYNNALPRKVGCTTSAGT